MVPCVVDFGREKPYVVFLVFGKEHASCDVEFQKEDT
jgi:hypothetical protein